MKMMRIAGIATLLITGTTMAGIVNFTAEEGYQNGAELNSHPDWVAHGHWVSNVTGAEGMAHTASGGFTRAINIVGLENKIDSPITVSATFSLIGNFTTPGEASQDWQRGIWAIGLTEESVNCGEATLRAGVELQLNESYEIIISSGGQVVNMGPAASYDGHVFKVITVVTKSGADLYTVSSSVDSLDDNAEAFRIESSVASAELGGVEQVYGMVASYPVAGKTEDPVHAYNGINMNQFSVVPDLDTLGFLLNVN